MRGIFWKEFRENRALLWLGFALAVVIINVYAVSLRVTPPTPAARQDLNLLCGAVLLGLAGLVILATTANLFATEKARGTLPYLLALPVSRPRIWLAKVLGALALSAASVFLLFAPVLLLIPGVARATRMTVYLPDIILWVLLVLAVTVFFSVLLTRAISVALASLLTLIALVSGSVFAVLAGGVTLLGYDPALDVALLAFPAVPAFALASLAAFSRGELLQSARPWRVALPVLVLVSAVEVAGLLGGARWAYRYQRAEVDAVHLASLPSGGSVAAVVIQGSPAPYRREFRSGWERGRGAYRSTHLVLVGLASGRDLLALPRHPGDLSGKDVKVSPDGRYLAVTGRPDWLEFRPGAIEVWNVRTAQRIYQGIPRQGYGPHSYYRPASWSPVGDWLAVYFDPVLIGSVSGFVETNPELAAEANHGLAIMRPDGSERSEIAPPRVEAPYSRPYARTVQFGWDPAGRAAYTIAPSNRLVRRHLPGGKAKLIWQAPAPDPHYEHYERRFSPPLVSADGRWITLAVDEPNPWGWVPNRPVERSYFTWIVAADGSRAFTRRPQGWENAAWSGDGNYLYLIAGLSGGAFEISRWQASNQQTVALNVPPDLAPSPGLRYSAFPDRPSLVIWSEKAAYLVDEQGRFRPLRSPASAALIHAPGQPGVDRQGRIIVASANGESLLAVDVFAGTVTKVYP